MGSKIRVRDLDGNMQTVETDNSESIQNVYILHFVVAFFWCIPTLFLCCFKDGQYTFQNFIVLVLGFIQTFAASFVILSMINDDRNATLTLVFYTLTVLGFGLFAMRKADPG